jgi:hypothetical protein
MIRRIVSAIAALLVLSGCGEYTAAEYFSDHKEGGADYGLYKRGSFYTNELYHVASVHGFVDDLPVCMQIAEMLNETEPGMFSCQPLNH